MRPIWKGTDGSFGHAVVLIDHSILLRHTGHPAATRAAGTRAGGWRSSESDGSRTATILEAFLAIGSVSCSACSRWMRRRLFEVQALQADFDENMLPGLEFAEQDCFFAEVPVREASDWLCQVRLLNGWGGSGDHLVGGQRR